MANTQRAPYGEPQAAPVDVPATKRDLTSWWKQFKKNSRREEDKARSPAPTGIFGVPLAVSIQYAHVAISLYDEGGRSFIYGYVPIIVAKCGVFLKEQATEIEGIFRLAGAERRIKELQVLFNSPDRYGKGLDWTGYTVHDAANVLRRYLNQLPEPIIPLDFYQRFREPLKNHQNQAVGSIDMQEADIGEFDAYDAIRTYQTLITELPPLNRQLLLYILDLVAVFASKSDTNRMTASNLAAIFQPGLLSHPDHDMAPAEYRLSQDVLIFLIQQQDHFLVGMQGTAADEKTIQEVESGVSSPARSSETPTTTSKPQQTVVRSPSAASAGADSLRKFGGVRRNVSVSSRQSRQSANSPSPVTPPTSSPYLSGGKSSGVHRSNTLPTKKLHSPGQPGGRLSRDRSSGRDSPAVGSPAIPVAASPLANSNTNLLVGAAREESQSAHHQDIIDGSPAVDPKISPHLKPVLPTDRGRLPSQESISKSGNNSFDASPTSATYHSAAATPVKERSFSHIFNKSPSTDGERGETRKHNKLQKRRNLSANPSANSSAQSLSQGDPVPVSVAQSETTASTETRMDVATIESSDAQEADKVLAIDREAIDESPVLQRDTVADSAKDSVEPFPIANEGFQQESVAITSNSTALKDMPQRASGVTLRPSKTAQELVESESSMTEQSETDVMDETPPAEIKKEKKHRWRMSRSERRTESNAGNTLAIAGLGSGANAERSTSTVGSFGRVRQSFTDESGQRSLDGSSSSQAALGTFISNEGEIVGAGTPSEKKGPLGWFRGKLQERKERARSPPPTDGTERTESIGATMESATASEVKPIGPSQEELIVGKMDMSEPHH